jgi:hypothetical protein
MNACKAKLAALCEKFNKGLGYCIHLLGMRITCDRAKLNFKSLRTYSDNLVDSCNSCAPLNRGPQVHNIHNYGITRPSSPVRSASACRLLFVIMTNEMPASTRFITTAAANRLHCSHDSAPTDNGRHTRRLKRAPRHAFQSPPSCGHRSPHSLSRSIPIAAASHQCHSYAS